jgi:digeranylgeranylglycerophospholipid reductase
MVEIMQDAVVIGGGPAGSFFAYQLAKQGITSTVFEEHSAIGLPSHCAGHISIRSLRNIGLYPLPEGIVENTFSAANFYSPNGTKFSVHLNKPVTCVINRAKFDRFLAQKAQKAGVHIELGHRVQSLLFEQGFVKGVNVVVNGDEKKVESKLVVDAEGISSRLLRQAGLQSFTSSGLVYAVEAEIDGVSGIEEHAVEAYLGKDYADGFYGWVIPMPDGTAKLGLACKKGNPNQHLQTLIHKHPVASKQLKNAKINKKIFHAITLGGPIKQAYTNGFLAVGDCASQVKPTTGGGVVFSLICAKIAAEVAAKAIKEGDFSLNTLQSYQRGFMEKLGFDMNFMLKARRMANSLSDAKIDRAFHFALKMGLADSLSDIDEIDFQGRTMIALLKKPAAYASIAYLLTLFLPTNA